MILIYIFYAFWLPIKKGVLAKRLPHVFVGFSRFVALTYRYLLLSKQNGDMKTKGGWFHRQLALVEQADIAALNVSPTH